MRPICAKGREDDHVFGLSWHNLSVSTSSFHKKKKDEYILRPSCGFVSNGHICGIIGPSGSGKSTLLSAISGTTLKSSKLEALGSVWVDEKDAETGEKKAVSLSLGDGEIALLTQDTSFFTMLTPREILSFAAFLQLPLPASSREEIVDRTIESLGLTKVQHHHVGNRQSGSGLSGGEKRRLAVGVELVTMPKVFLADEPTTGLDSCQAEKVVSLMGELVKENDIPCLCVIHQPRASIWKRLDSFILMAPGGKMCYMGSRENAIEYFKNIGYECPPQTNPAEYFIDLVSVDTEDPEQASIDLERIEHIHAAFTKSNIELFHQSKPDHIEAAKRSFFDRRVNIMKRFCALFGRAWRQNIRDSKQNLLRLLASVGQAVLFKLIYKTVEKGPILARSISDRCAMISFGAISMSMMSLIKALDMFGSEKPIVNRERMRQQYTGMEYLFSKALAEIPLDSFFSMVFAWVLKSYTGVRAPLSTLLQIFSLVTVSTASLGFAIGSFSHDRESALSTGVPTLVVFMAVGVINPSGVDVVNEPPSPFVHWLKQISPIKWAIEALCIAEYKGMTFAKTNKGKFWGLPKMGAFALVKDGEQVLEAIGLGGKSLESVMKSLAILSGINLCIAVVGLVQTRTNFIETKESENYFIEDLEAVEEILNTYGDTTSGETFVIKGKSRVSKKPLKIPTMKSTTLK